MRAVRLPCVVRQDAGDRKPRRRPQRFRRRLNLRTMVADDGRPLSRSCRHRRRRRRPRRHCGSGAVGDCCWDSVSPVVPAVVVAVAAAAAC